MTTRRNDVILFSSHSCPVTVIALLEISFANRNKSTVSAAFGFSREKQHTLRGPIQAFADIMAG